MTDDGYFDVPTEIAVGLVCEDCGCDACARGDKSRIVYCGWCGREWHPGDDDYPQSEWKVVEKHEG